MGGGPCSPERADTIARRAGSRKLRAATSRIVRKVSGKSSSMIGNPSVRMKRVKRGDDIARYQSARCLARRGEVAVDGVGLIRELRFEALAKLRLRCGDGEIEAGEMQDVVVLGQGLPLQPPIAQIVQQRIGLPAQVVQASSEMEAPFPDELVRHAAEHVVPLKDEDPLFPEFRKQAGGRQTADAGPDHDHIDVFVRHHLRPDCRARV